MGRVVMLAERLPPPSAVRCLEPPTGEEPHTFFARMLRLWTIGAERFCGLGWATRVLENQVAYMHGRQVYNRSYMDARKWNLLHNSPKIRALAKLRLSQNPAPRRRLPLLPS